MLALVPLYLGSLYARLDKCVQNVTKLDGYCPANQYNFELSVDVSMGQVLLLTAELVQFLVVVIGIVHKGTPLDQEDNRKSQNQGLRRWFAHASEESG